jgi:hypothetical protein
MDIDSARQRNPFDGQFLVVDPIGGKTGEKDSDDGDETDDEAQPNHSPTR